MQTCDMSGACGKCHSVLVVDVACPFFRMSELQDTKFDQNDQHWEDR